MSGGREGGEKVCVGKDGRSVGRSVAACWVRLCSLVAVRAAAAAGGLAARNEGCGQTNKESLRSFVSTGWAGCLGEEEDIGYRRCRTERVCVLWKQGEFWSVAGAVRDTEKSRQNSIEYRA